ncbi:hypothetical protein A7A08_01676 [Methyloligella halotolerans]|uniref:Uncharacterized protein n=1 Tax=Methyloligella halotolerans TaxID=1177755 RepID=A0A1E2RZK3_9HYPH|nr:hypothetical protein [Methyloligella halotolerans]ODA67641.1 hypothetical protein A7A08_01676 [Methyloligella halotolerans]
MSSEKPCSKLQAFFVLEGQRMLREAIEARPGDKLEAQVASAAIAFALPFDFCWRVHLGRCGQRAFLRLYDAYRAWKIEQDRQARAEDVAERLDQLERTLQGLADRLPAVACAQADPDGQRDRPLRLVGAAAG